MAKAKKVVKKKIEKEEFTIVMQDNILLTTLLQIVKHAYNLESDPQVCYWPHTRSVDMMFMEERLDSDEMEKYSSLCSYPRDEPLNGLPTYRVSVNTEVFDHEKCEMVGLNGKMMVVISIDFNPRDWEMMTKAPQGAIIHLETDWEKERREKK